MIAGRSISFRLTTWFSSVFFLGLVLFGASMWFNLDSTLTAGRSKTLSRRADRLGELLRETEGDPPEKRARKFQAFADATGGGLVEVLETDGTRALPSPSAARAFPWPKLANLDHEQFSEVSFSGQPYRVLVRPLSDSRPLVLCVAAPLEGNRLVLGTFSAGLLWAIPVMLVLSALGGYALSRRALAPVDRITAATRSISVSNLSERLPVPGTRDELQRLSETCNEMLARLESAVSEIKRFTADASHELRSPLSFMRTVAELALRNRQTDEASRRAFEEIVEECRKAGRLLEDMLTLARAEAGDANPGRELVDLAEVATEVCDKARMLPDAERHTLTVSLDDEHVASVWGDYSSLRRLLWILVENAVKYTPSPGRIRVALRVVDQRATVTVEDNGVGISAADLPHIFQRFYRVDPSRSEVEGFGLGLAIAKCIADAHRALLSADSKAGGGSVFSLVLPVSAASSVLAAGLKPRAG